MRKRKKILSLLLAVMMCMGGFVSTDFSSATNTYAGGNGTESDPYQIVTAEQLQALATAVNSGTSYSGQYFVLNNNIDLTGISWTPIGNSSYPFQGKFDGKKHIIYNLTINTSSQYCGLFGRTKNADIKNLGIENANISSSAADVAVIVGNDLGGSNISCCYSTGTVKGRGAVGGIIGSTHGSSNPTTVENSYTRVALAKTGSTADVSGISAWNYSGSIKVNNCYSACIGEVRPIVGWSDGSAVKTANVTSTYFDKTLSPNFEKTGFTDLGKTSEELKQSGTYTGWNFTDIWALEADKNGGYPYLKGFTPGLGGAPGSISFTVKDSSGKPIEDASVNITNSSSSITLNHQGNGVYSNVVTTTGETYTLYINGSQQGTITQSGSNAVIQDITYTPSAVETFTVEITVKKDDAEWNDSNKTIALYQNNQSKCTLQYSNGKYTANVEKGTYDVYVDGVDAGVDVSTASKSATVDFYTVTYSQGSGSGDVPTADPVLKDSTYTVSTSKPLTLSGYTQTGWHSQEYFDTAGKLSSFPVNGKITLYPMWATKSVTINTSIKYGGSDVDVNTNSATWNGSDLELKTGLYHEDEKGSFTCQWKKKENDNYIDITGANSDTINITAPNAGIYEYRCYYTWSTTRHSKKEELSVYFRVEIKSAKETATAPILSAAYNSVMVENAVSGQKYICKKASETAPTVDSGEWKPVNNGLTFTGLDRNTSYKVYTYKPKTDNNHADSDVVNAYIRTAKEKITEVKAPENTTLTEYYNTAEQVKNALPRTLAVTSEGGSLNKLDINWANDGKYDSAPGVTNTFDWAVNAPEGYEFESGVKSSGSVTVTNKAATAVNHKGTNKEITYDGNTYDVSGLFTLDSNAGTAKYSILDEGTGKGSLTENMLTVTKAGTVKIKVTTASKGNYAAGEAVATLTVKKAENAWTKELSIEGWKFGETAKKPDAKAKFGETEYKYSSEENGTYSDKVPQAVGTYWVKAAVADTNNYSGLEAKISFSIVKAEQATPDAPSKDNASVTQNSITVKASVSGQQYILLPAEQSLKEDDWNNAKTGNGSDLIFEELNPGTSYIVYTRLPGDDTKEPSPSSSTSVTTSATTPAANEGYEIDWINEKIIVKQGYEISLSSDFKTLVNDGNIEPGQTIYVRKAAENNIPASAATETKLSDRPDVPEGVKAADETVKNKNDGKITGIDSSMEYKIGDNGAWTSGSADLTGLAGGTVVKVRIKATNTAPHGKECLYTIGASDTTLSVTFDTNGGSVVEKIGGISYNGIIDKPDDPTKTGENFIGWYSDEACTQAWKFETDKVTDNITIYAKWSKVPTYSVSGKVEGLEDNSDVNVTLKQGNKEVAKTTTNDKGDYSFMGVLPGVYNVVAEKDGKTMTILVTVEKADEEDQNITMPAENVNSVLEVAEDTPAVVVGNLNEEAKAVKKDQKGASSVTVKMTVEKKADVTESQDDEQDKTAKTQQDAIKKEAAGKTLTYLEINVEQTVKINDAAELTTKIENTVNVLEIVIPFDFSGKRDVKVYRYHGDSAESLAEDKNATEELDGTFRLDKEKGLIYVYASKFSTYAVGYTPATESGGSGDSESSASYSKLTFETNGGSTIDSITELYGNTIDLNLERYLPTREGYIFSGWYADKELSNKIESIRLDGNKTIYAAWTKNDDGSGIPIGKLDQEINIVIKKRYGDKTFNLGAKANTKLSYKSDNKKVVTVDDKGNVKIKGVGTAKITISAAENESYKATEKVVTIKVSKASQTIKIKKNVKTIKRTAVAKKAKTYTFKTTGKKTALKVVKLTKTQKKAIKSVKISGNKVKVTVKKGAKKGTYKLKVYAVANKNYKASAKKVITIRIK